MDRIGRTGGGGMYALPNVNRARIPVSDDPERQAAIRREFDARQEEANKLKVGDKVTCPGGKGKVTEVTRQGTIGVKVGMARAVTYHPSTVTKGW